jgi:hypothetical protein
MCCQVRIPGVRRLDPRLLFDRCGHKYLFTDKTYCVQSKSLAFSHQNQLEKKMHRIASHLLPILACVISFAVMADSSVPETGQTSCFDSSGVEVICSGTGQDGDLRKGVKWPTPRFTNNGNGTVTDNLTDLVWVQWVLCFQGQWEAALDHANNLADGQCGVSDASIAGEWRLPNIMELSSLVDFGEFAPALAAGHPFLPEGVQAPILWSSTSYERQPNQV